MGAKGNSYFLERDWGKLYYEIYGEGDPLLILHGNGGSSKGKHHLIPKLLDQYQVITVDSRCHGNSSCSDEDLDYFEMADDVYALMQALGHDNYTIWGHSDGGILGLILGYKNTDNIERMLISGANTRVSGLKPELLEMMKNYAQFPDPMMRKHFELMVNQKEIPMDSIKRIDIPVMLMVGDRDAVLLQHTMEIFESLPNSSLCILPSSSHFFSYEKADQIVYWLKEFKKPFANPSTIEIAKKILNNILKDN
ncbi:alpha/beta fold hydrolase [Marivirga atlantica]|jgi:pimeloyl-ACP methyl ester carboxylesterase